MSEVYYGETKNTDKYQTFQFSIKLEGGEGHRQEEAIRFFKRRIEESIPTQVGKVFITLKNFKRIK